MKCIMGNWIKRPHFHHHGQDCGKYPMSPSKHPSRRGIGRLFGPGLTALELLGLRLCDAATNRVVCVVQTHHTAAPMPSKTGWAAYSRQVVLRQQQQSAVTPSQRFHCADDVEPNYSSRRQLDQLRGAQTEADKTCAENHKLWD